jgi:hypothetical protein
MNEGMMNLYTLHIRILHFLFAFLFLRFKIMVMEVELIEENKKGQRGGVGGGVWGLGFRFERGKW